MFARCCKDPAPSVSELRAWRNTRLRWLTCCSPLCACRRHGGRKAPVPAKASNRPVHRERARPRNEMETSRPWKELGRALPWPWKARSRLLEGLPRAPQVFGKVWEALASPCKHLEGLGMPWKALLLEVFGGHWRTFAGPRHPSKALEGLQRHRKAFQGLGRSWKALDALTRLWKALEGLGKKALEGLGSP